MGAALFGLALLLGVATAHAQPSAADMETARSLFKQGNDLQDAGDQRGALEKYKAAHALGQTPITGLTLCQTHASLGQLVEARQVCLSVRRIPLKAPESPRASQARQDAETLAGSLEARIPSIRIELLGVVEGDQPELRVNSDVIPAAAHQEPRRVNPGTHTVWASLGAERSTSAKVELKEGEHRVVTLTLPTAAAPAAPVPGTGPTAPPPPALPPSKSLVDPAPAAPPTRAAPAPALPPEQPVAPEPAPPPPQPQPSSGSLSTAGYVVGGVGLAGLAIGTAFGLSARSSYDKVKEHCDSDTRRCDRTGADAADSGRSAQTGANIAFALGGVAIAAGVFMVLLDQDSETQVGLVVGPTSSLSLSSRF